MEVNIEYFKANNLRIIKSSSMLYNFDIIYIKNVFQLNIFKYYMNFKICTYKRVVFIYDLKICLENSKTLSTNNLKCTVLNLCMY